MYLVFLYSRSDCIGVLLTISLMAASEEGYLRSGAIRAFIRVHLR